MTVGHMLSRHEDAIQSLSDLATWIEATSRVLARRLGVDAEEIGDEISCLVGPLRPVIYGQIKGFLETGDPDHLWSLGARASIGRQFVGAEMVEEPNDDE